MSESFKYTENTGSVALASGLKSFGSFNEMSFVSPTLSAEPLPVTVTGVKCEGESGRAVEVSAALDGAWPPVISYITIPAVVATESMRPAVAIAFGSLFDRGGGRNFEAGGGTCRLAAKFGCDDMDLMKDQGGF